MHPQAFVFFKKLKKNNNREWFHQNKALYDKTKEEFTILISSVIKYLGKNDVQIASLQPQKTIFRIYRDVRFSKDKTPYKTHISAYLNREGKNINTPGYYIHLEPDNCFISAGLYYPDTAQLKMVRQEIDYNLKDFAKILSSRKLKQTFTDGLSFDDSLSRPPKGYSYDNPAIEYLKLKSIIITRDLDAHLFLEKDAPKIIAGYLNAATPLIRFLQEALSEPET